MICAVLFVAIACTVQVRADIVGNYKDDSGKTWYIDVLTTSATTGEIWQRVTNNSSSPGDQKMIDIKLQSPNPKVSDLKQYICAAKEAIDTTKMAVGCITSVEAFFCLVGDVATEGATVDECQMTIDMALNGAAKNCLDGLSDLIGSKLAGDAAWANYGLQQGITQADFGKAMGAVLDLICKQ